MMGQTIVQARELRREDLISAEVRCHLAQRGQSIEYGAEQPWQVMRTAVRAVRDGALRSGFVRWRHALVAQRAP